MFTGSVCLIEVLFCCLLGIRLVASLLPPWLLVDLQKILSQRSSGWKASHSLVKLRSSKSEFIVPKHSRTEEEDVSHAANNWRLERT